MTSEKSKTNKKWTSTEAFRDGHERIFGKKKRDPEEAAKELNPFKSNSGGWAYTAWQDGFLADKGATNPYENRSQLTESWEGGRSARVAFDEGQVG